MTALKFELGADGIALLSIDVPGRPMNVLTPELLWPLVRLAESGDGWLAMLSAGIRYRANAARGRG